MSVGCWGVSPYSGLRKLQARVVYISIRGVIVDEAAIAVNGVIINNLARTLVKKVDSQNFKCTELTTMVTESSTRDVWISYQAVCYQDIPRFDGYPEDAQTTLSHYLVNQEYVCGKRSSVWSLSETVIWALESFPSTKPIGSELTA